MKSFYCLLLLVIIECGLHAQFCHRTSLFFNNDKSKLTDRSIITLDSLIAVMGEEEYLVEIYGMTDSVGSGNYNQKLAEKRMTAAEAYISKKSTADITFRKKNQIESITRISGSKEENLAYNRRVDIFLVPLSNGEIQLTSKEGAQALYPLNYFEPCGVCNSSPSLDMYTNNEAAREAGITFQSVSGDSLVTAGSLFLNSRPCAGSSNDTATITYKICPDIPDPEMSIWKADTIDGKVFWRETSIPLQIDPATGCYVFRAGGGGINVDRPATRRIRSDTMYRLVLPVNIEYGKILITSTDGIRRYSSETGSVAFDKSDTMLLAKMFIEQDGHYSYASVPIHLLQSTFIHEGYYNIRIFTPDSSNFQNLFPAEPLQQKIRVGKPGNEKFGYYFPGYNIYLPIDSMTSKYYFSPQPGLEYHYAIKRGKRLYVNSQDVYKSKFRKKKNIWQIKFKGDYMKNFKLVKDYSMPRGKKSDDK